MKKNMSNTDRITRAVIALVLLFLNFTGIATDTAGIILYILSGVFLLTAFTGFCPLYSPFHFSTNKS